MYKYCLTYCLLLLAGYQTSLFGQTDSRTLAALIQQGAFTRARSLLKGSDLDLSASEKQFYEALVLNSFNDAAQSNQLLLQIKHPEQVLATDTLQKLYYAALYDNYIKLFQYKKAYAAGTQLLQRFRKFYTTGGNEDEEQALLIYKALQNTAPQTLQKHKDTRLPLTRDIAGLMNIPVNVGDSVYSFIFDSGAGMCTITDSYARKLGLTPVPSAPVSVKSGLGIASKVQLALAPELRLGNITVRNSVFLVFPDSALSFAGGAYKINGIIGFPVAKEMDELVFENDSLFVPQQPLYQTPATQQNLAVDELTPILFLSYNQQELPFTFDTGAGSSLFSDLFYKADSVHLNTVGTAKSLAMGGAGGDKTFSGVNIPSLQLQNQSHTIVLSNAFVSKEPVSVSEDKYYGNLGQDVIKQFKKMVINFTRGYLLFEESSRM